MGKHDKKEQQTVFRWEPPKDEWYKARISTLEKENDRLRQDLDEREKCIGVYELTVDHQDEIHSGIIAEYKDLLDEKDDEIEVLKGRIKMLEAAIGKGALREVLA